MIVAALALAMLLAMAAPASAVTQKQAAQRALKALGSNKGSNPVILFGLTKPARPGTVVTQAGTTKPSKGSTKGLKSKLRNAGVRVVKAPVVLRGPKDERVYFFYEDRGPFQLYQHPGRVALVGVDSGKVQLSRTITWPPLLNGKLPTFLRTSGRYRSSKYQVFYRPWTTAAAPKQQRSNRSQFQNDPFGPGRPLPSLTNSKTIANRLAAENSCVLRVTDTLPSFWNVNDLNLTRSYVGTLFEQLENDNAGFIDDRYGARSGETLAAAVDRLVKAGCKDILLYIAGQGYRTGGEPVIHLGTQAVRGNLRQQNLSLSDLRTLISGRPGVTFKLKIDAPFAGGMIDGLRTLTNVLLVETSSAAGEEAFAFVPEVSAAGRIVDSTSNPAGLLEFTNCELIGLKQFFDSAEEIDKATQAQNEGVSFLVEMLARAQELCAQAGGGFADDLGAFPQLYAQKRGSGNGTNRPPKADQQDVTVDEDTPKSITLVASDPDGDPLTYTITKQPDHGTLSGSGATRTYTPDPNYTGSDDFSFKAEDDNGASSNTAKVSITVVPANDPPTVTTSAGNTAYTESAAAVVVDGSLTVTDPDDTELNEATVRIHADDFQPGDTLEFSFNPGDPITGFYDSGTGVLTLTPTTGSGTVPVADMQAALRTVKFASSHDGPITPKRIQFSASDGDAYGPPGTKNVAITNVNDPPVVDANDLTLIYDENSGPQAVDPGFVIDDPDSNTLASAEVKISSGHVQAEDELAFVNQNGITGVYNDSTGTLTLTGTASTVDYLAAIQSITYENNSDNPNTGTRTVSFKVNDGEFDSNTDTRDIQITASNDAPVVTTSAGSTAYTEGDPATPVDGALTVSDVDDTEIESAQVRISGNFEAGDDLVFVDQLGITGTYNSGTGVLTLSGTASESDYQTALRSVGYRNTSDDNIQSPKTVEFKVNDGEADSMASFKDIAVTGVNDAPTVDASAGSASYTEGGTAATVDPSFTVTDPDDTNLESAEVRISANFSAADGDTLNFVDQNGISGVYNSGTGVLTLTGTSTVANYQAAIRTITYSNTSDNPSTATRTVSFKANDGSLDSNTDTRDVTVAGSNDPPAVTTSAGNTAYTEGDPATQIDGALTVTDADDTNIESAQVRISANFESGDDLVFADQNGITGTYNSGTGVLTLTGTSSKANYETALRDVDYRHTGDNPATSKTIEFKVNDGNVDSNLATKGISITRVNDAPVVNMTDAALSYTEDSGHQVLDSGLALSDPDSTQIQGATVQITSNHVQAADELAFTNQLGITGAYNDSTGTLTLSGTTTVANYQTALRSVTYENTDGGPDRVVTTNVTDAEGATSVGDTRTIDIQPANDPPVVTTSSGATAYAEGDPSTPVDTALTVTDDDDTNIESAVVRISTGFESGDDLVFADQNGITGTYNSGTGVLTLSGTSSKANYETALRSVGYRHTGDNPSGSKQVGFVVNDGSANSAEAFKTINITGVNDGPVLTTSGSALAYTEGDGAVAADPGLLLDDPENNNITGATVEISANHVQADDELAFTNQLGITGVYNDSTGVLTLSGTTTEANYQTALRSVTYENSNQDPSGSKTVRFQTTGDTGSPSQPSNQATRTINLTAANDAPVVTTTAGDTPYTEGDPAKEIDGPPTTSGLTVTDADDTNIEGGQVRISSGFQSGDDLVFADQNGISGTYNSGTGVLTLTGTSSVANYETALRSIKFQTTNDNPSSSKTVEFKVNDGGTDSNLATKNIAITGANDAPSVTTTAADLAYTEGDGAVAADNGLTVSDPENNNISGATVSITANHVQADDELAFTNQLGITGAYNDSTGTLTLSGTTTVANYQTALRSVTYENVNQDPSGSKTISFQVTDQPGAPSNVANRTVNLTGVNDAPVVTTTAGDTPWTEGDPAVTIDSGVTVADADDTNIEGGQVRISSGFQSGDNLVFVDQNGISGVYNSGTGVLTLTGTSSKANYQTALQSIKFQSTNPAPVSSKTVEFKVNDGGVDSNLATKNLAVTGINSAPSIGAGHTLNYTENQVATAADGAVTVTEPEGDNIGSGSAELTTNYASGQDELTWSDNNLADNITLDGVNSVLNKKVALMGTDTAANYQLALQNVKYFNSSESPSANPRTVEFKATDSPGGATGTGTSIIQVASVDDNPVAVDDPGGAVSVAETTVLEDAAATIIPVRENDTDVDGGPMNIQSVSNSTNGTATLDAGEAKFQPTANFCGTAGFDYELSPGGDTAHVTMTVTCVNDAPTAVNDTFNGAESAIGNTTLAVSTNPSGPKKTITGNVLTDDTDSTGSTDDDSDIDGPGPLVVTDETKPTTDGGTVDIDSNGTFTYISDPEDNCGNPSDTFTYTVSDQETPTPGTAVGTVTVDIERCVWYVKNNHPDDPDSLGDGTSTNPFDTIQEAEAESLNGHTVFVFDGDNTANKLNTGTSYVMNTNERLIGEHEGLTLPDPDGGGQLTTENLHPATANAHPTLTDTNDDVIDLATGTEVRGIEVDPQGTGGGICAGTDCGGQTATGTTLDDIRVVDTFGTDATGPGLDYDAAVATHNVTGDLFIDNGDGVAATTTDSGIRLNSSGTVNFTSAGTKTITTDGAKGLDATGTNFGADSVFDAITVTDSGSGGVSVVNASPGTLTFGDASGTDLSLTTTSGTDPAFRVSSGGTISVPSAGTANVSATGGPAVDVTGTSGATLNFDDVNSTNSSTAGGSGDGINLSGLGAGTFSAAAGANTFITGAAGIAFDLDGGNGTITFPGDLNNGPANSQAAEITSRTVGGSSTVTLSGDINDTNDAGGGIVVSGNSGGSTEFSGNPKTINTTTSAGVGNPLNIAVSMTGNTGHTASFTGGGLDIDTGIGNGFDAQTGGTVNVVGTGNSIVSTTGRALRIDTVDIGASDVTFQSIGSNGAANGIRLNSTGTAGGLIVTGDGDGTADGGGGTIDASTADNVFLNSTQDVSLSDMNIHNAADSGITADAVTNMDLDKLVMNNNGAQSEGGAVQDSGIHLEDLVGASNTISSTNVIDSRNTGLDWDPNASPSGMSTLAVTDSKFNSAGEAAGQGNSGASIVATSTANVKLTMTNVEMNDNPSAGIITSGQNTSTTRVDLSNVDIKDTTGIVDSNRGIQWGLNHTATGIYRVTGSEFNNLGDGAGVSIGMTANNDATYDATISSNTIGTAGVPRSGNFNQYGIASTFEDTIDAEVEISSNTIQRTNWEGIILQNVDFVAPFSGDGAVEADYNVHNNTVGAPDDLQPPPIVDLNGIEVWSYQDSNVCLDITGNTAEGKGADPLFSSDIFVWQDNTALFRIERLVGTTDALAATHVNNENPADEVSAFSATGTGFLGVPNNTCAAPTTP